MRRCCGEPYRRRSGLTAVPDISLNNGVTIRQLGCGVFQIEPEQTPEATRTALEVGYRHLHTGVTATTTRCAPSRCSTSS